MKKRILTIVSLVLIVAMCTVIFASCIPSKYENAEKKLEKEGYTIILSGGKDDATTKTQSALFRAANSEMQGNLVGYVSAINNDGEACTIYYFSKASDATLIYKQLKEDADEDTVVKKSGKAVFTGTKQAWKDL